MLIVARLPPVEDGITRYAGQLAGELQPSHEVRSTGIPFEGRDRMLWGALRPLRIARYARGCDDVLVHYHPHYYVRGALASRLVCYGALATLVWRQRTTVVVHEPDDPLPEGIGWRGRVAFRLEERVRRALWRRAARLVFHTEFERRSFAARFPGRRREDRVVAHGSFFVPVVELSQGDARRRLGLRTDRVLLLCIGFLSPHKCWERAIRAVDEADLDGVELHLVGSPIRQTPEVESHAENLRRLAAKSRHTVFCERFVSDEEFDLWVRAADALVVPYRSASSSGVVVRAHLLDTPVITSGVGGLAEQIGPGDLPFASDEELVAAIRAIAARAPAPS